eukprot:gene1649-2463_t
MGSLSDGVAQVKAFLEGLNLGTYLDLLIDEGYDDLRSVRTLTEKDLNDIGFKRGHIKRLLAAVEEEKEQHQQQAQAARAIAAQQQQLQQPQQQQPQVVLPSGQSVSPVTPQGAEVQGVVGVLANVSSWTKIERVTPPPKFDTKFADLCKMGCYCWRIVEELSDKGRRSERVLAITTPFVFIASLEASISTALRTQDLERVIVQERSSSSGAMLTQVAIKPFAHCNEPTVIVVLRHDKRNAINDPMHPLAALNYVVKLNTRAPLEISSIGSETDMRKVPGIGFLSKPAGYMDPVTKLKKWKETGKWGSTDVDDADAGGADEGGAEHAHESRSSRRELNINEHNKLILGKDKNLQYWVDGQLMTAAVAEVTCKNDTISIGGTEVQMAVEESRRDRFFSALGKLCHYAKVTTHGLPARRKEERNKKELLTNLPDVVFTDAEGDQSTFCVSNGVLQLWANGKLEMPDIPAGVRAVGLPIAAQPGTEQDGEATPPSTEGLKQKVQEQEQEVAELKRELLALTTSRAVKRRGSSDSVSTATSRVSTSSWRYEPYGEDTDFSQHNSSFGSHQSNARLSLFTAYDNRGPEAAQGTRPRGLTGSTVESESSVPPALLSSCSECVGSEYAFTPGSSAISGVSLSTDPMHDEQIRAVERQLHQKENEVEKYRQLIAGLQFPALPTASSGIVTAYTMQLKIPSEPLGFEYGTVPGALVITSVDPVGAAGRAGLQARCALVSVNGKKIVVERDLLDAVRDLRERRAPVFVVEVMYKYNEYTQPVRQHQPMQNQAYPMSHMQQPRLHQGYQQPQQPLQPIRAPHLATHNSMYSSNNNGSSPHHTVGNSLGSPHNGSNPPSVCGSSTSEPGSPTANIRLAVLFKHGRRGEFIFDQ